ncbi:hypothetical protein JVU11DRAFT_3465 [Chiua virens]|nr:hypothetical protein JVU11DRAFT_3465 [Chiua virens]
MNLHQILKDAHKNGSARTDEGQTFKKPFQTVGHPQTIDHNMHDDFVHNPPKVHRLVLNTSCVDRTFSRTLSRANMQPAQVTDGLMRPKMKARVIKKGWAESNKLTSKGN